jgi:glucose/arabinose dehydrogenase
LGFLLGLLLLAVPALRSTAVEVPAGFTTEVLATNLDAATAIAPAPDGRIFITEQTGHLLVWKPGAATPARVLELHVTDYWERGLIGLALDPAFPRVPHLFLLYVTDRPFVHHVLSRFTVHGDTVEAASEKVLFEGDDQARLGGTVPAGHQGGPLRFGPQGKLFVSIGEQTAGSPSQQLDTLQGKILRLNPDGTIPEDNPLVSRTTGKYRALYALGVRNSFGLALQPETGRMFFTDVGGSAFEEVNELTAGANYGWPLAEGFSTNAAFQQPLHAYSPLIGQSIVGGTFVARGAAWPAKWQGKFLFADFMKHWVKALDPDAPTNVISFARGLNGPVATEFAPDGSLLVLNRAAVWRDPKRFVPNAGSLLRIRYTGAPALASRPRPGPSAGPSKWGVLGLPQSSADLPRRLSQSGLFAYFTRRSALTNVVNYNLNLETWEPGVAVENAMALPTGSSLHFSASGDWALPPGAALIRHTRLPASSSSPGRPLETRIYVAAEPCGYGAAYRWQEDGHDAELVEDAEVATVNVPGAGGKASAWFFSGVEPCLASPGTSLAFAPMFQLNARQLNQPGANNPLHQFARLHLLEGLPAETELLALPRLAHWSNTSASLELRVRGYLDVHCAMCHQPGGASRGLFDARFATPLAQAGILNGDLAAGDLGTPGAKVVVPGAPDKSILLRRLKDTGFFRMPPVQYHNEPSPIIPVLEAWIRQLPSQVDLGRRIP